VAHDNTEFSLNVNSYHYAIDRSQSRSVVFENPTARAAKPVASERIVLCSSGGGAHCWGSSLRSEYGPSWSKADRFASTNSATVSGFDPLMTSTRLFSPAKIPSR
jgi:hypothetical protein